MNLKDYIRCRSYINKSTKEVLKKIYKKDIYYKDTKELIIKIKFKDDETSITYDYNKGDI